MADQDTEITLGLGKILTMFVGLVVLCAIFFGAGYTVGKNATSQPLNLSANSQPNSAPSSTNKPSPSIAGTSSSSAADALKSQDCPNGDCSQPSSELTFYKNVEQKDPNPQLLPAEAQPEKVTVQPTPARVPPETAKSAVPAGATGYIVQVAAVSKQQDAEALVAALRRKQYPVAVVTVINDRLYHVQAGPFGDQKEAEALRSRLINDGYNPILKH